MTGLPIESKYQGNPDEPIAEADREDLTRRLNDAYTNGQIDVDRYQGLLDGLYQAERQGQLVPVIHHLPVEYRSDAPAVAGEAPRIAAGEMPQRSTELDVRGAYQVMKPWYWLAGGLAVAVLLIMVLILVF